MPQTISRREYQRHRMPLPDSLNGQHLALNRPDVSGLAIAYELRSRKYNFRILIGDTRTLAINHDLYKQYAETQLTSLMVDGS